ncbi:MAG TPA: type II toxin-antitoxin system VapC family toxin [Xanthobacteraceae bacterium]|nr:type II toxin-antitoxin system VapC family toxin [Xanthobacteraceae bacterium]
MILLDTHVAIWFTTNTKFGKRSTSIVERAQAAGELVISAISFWEIAMLISKGRLRALKSASEQRSKILASGIQERPLSGEICVLAGELENLHADPADRLLAATAITLGATLVTADERLLRWRHPVKRHNAET